MPLEKYRIPRSWAPELSSAMVGPTGTLFQHESSRVTDQMKRVDGQKRTSHKKKMTVAL